MDVRNEVSSVLRLAGDYDVVSRKQSMKLPVVSIITEAFIIIDSMDQAVYTARDTFIFRIKN